MRRLIWFLTALVGAGCSSPDPLMIWINVDGLEQAQVKQLRGRAVLKGIPGKFLVDSDTDSFRVTENLSRFGIRLPNGATRDGLLCVGVEALDGQGQPLLELGGSNGLQLEHDPTQAEVQISLRGRQPSDVSWSVHQDPPTARFNSIWWLDAANFRWVVGDEGNIGKWADTTGFNVTQVGTNHLYGVWGSAANEVWAVGDMGTILKFDGTKWTSQQINPPNMLRAVWGSGANSVWTVGVTGTIFRFDGSNWMPQTSGTTQTLYSIWGNAPNNVWAVGETGTILKFDGTMWRPQASGTTQTLHSVWGSASNSVWAVGEAGTILKFDGSSWLPQTSGTTSPLYSIWGSAADKVWAVGSCSTVLKGNGNSWKAQLRRSSILSPSTVDIAPSAESIGLKGVWGLDDTDFWVVGDHGTVAYTQ